MTIEQAIYTHLKTISSGETGNVTRQDARTQLQTLVGQAIFLGRVAERKGEDPPPVGICIRKLSGGHDYNTVAEEPSVQPVIEFLALGRDPYGLQVVNVIELLRVVFSGYVGSMPPHYIGGATVEFSGQAPPQYYGDGSDTWTHQHVIDFQFTVDSVVP